MKLSIYTREFYYNMKLAYPVVIGMLGHTLVQLIDNIMVGQLGPTELAAVSLGNSFVFYCNVTWYWFFDGNYTINSSVLRSKESYRGSTNLYPWFDTCISFGIYYQGWF